MRRWAGASPALDAGQAAELMRLKPAMAEARATLRQVEALAQAWGKSTATLRRYLNGNLPKRYGGVPKWRK